MKEKIKQFEFYLDNSGEYDCSYTQFELKNFIAKNMLNTTYQDYNICMNLLNGNRLIKIKFSQEEIKQLYERISNMNKLLLNSDLDV